MHTYILPQTYPKHTHAYIPQTYPCIHALNTPLKYPLPKACAGQGDASTLRANFDNHAVQRVTMAGAVSTVAGNREKGYADGVGAAAHFNSSITKRRGGGQGGHDCSGGQGK
jgi:hypothetical protein